MAFKAMNTSNNLTTKKIEQLSNDELFKNEGIIVDTDAQYCCKKAPGKKGNSVKLLSNYFGLKPENSTGTIIYQYDIEIEKVFDSGKRAVINKQRNTTEKTNDFLEHKSRNSLITLWPVFQEVLKKYHVSKPASAITDFKRILYVLDPIHMNFTTQVEPKDQFSLVLEKFEFPQLDECLMELKGVAKIEYKLRYTTHFDAMNSIFSENLADRDGLQYLSLLTSMKMTLDKENTAVYENGKNYLTNPGQYGFKPDDTPDLADGKRLAVGCQKSIKLMEGNCANSGIAIAIDTKKTAFHKSMNLLEKFDTLLTTPRGINKFVGAHAQKVIGNMKGLACRCTHLKDNVIIISDITTETASKKIVEINGRKISVSEYYKQKYKITLRRPDSPLVVQKKIINGKKQLCYYPMELLEVADFQRVKQCAQTPEQISTMIRQCATAPKKRLTEIHNLFASLQLNNEYMKEAGFSIVNKTLETTGRKLQAPAIGYGSNKVVTIRNINGNWDMQKNEIFKIPSTITNWHTMLIEGRGRFSINKNIAEQFVKKYTYCARSHGIKITDCSGVHLISSDERDMLKVFEDLKKQKPGFVLFLTPDSVTHLHNLVKLYEKNFEIPTQDLKHSTISKIIEKNQMRTLDNIIMKSNIKVGGHNYDLIDVVKDNRMVIGIGFNHTMSGETDSLSVIGYAANTRKNPSEFAGDVHFTQFGRDGQIQFYENVIRNTVKNFKASRGILPKEIVIYRTSGSEGRYNEYCIYDIPYIKKKMQENAPGSKLVFIVVDKNHNVRFFKDQINPSDRCPAQNVAPGSVIDTGVTNPKLCEFYLTSHSGLQGTAKTPRYTILYDDVKLSMDELENLTNSLAYGYQIVNLPTSLPAPIYIANQYAERGRNVLNANNHRQGRKTVISDEVTANKALSYARTVFNNVRVNA